VDKLTAVIGVTYNKYVSNSPVITIVAFSVALLFVVNVLVH